MTVSGRQVGFRVKISRYLSADVPCVYQPSYLPQQVAIETRPI